jgi:hypothetical protein
MTAEVANFSGNETRAVLGFTAKKANTEIECQRQQFYQLDYNQSKLIIGRLITNG